MPGRMIWKQQQDNILRYLRQVRGQQKWTSIAQAMTNQFHTRIRSGKQCRQRYNNHLSATLTHQVWTPDQEAVLLELYEQLGNKWATIAQQLPGRSDNCVKNHFYSKLRKAARRINRLATDNHRKHKKIFDRTLLSKIIAVSDSRFVPDQHQNHYWVKFAFSLIQRLYNIETCSQNNSQQQGNTLDINQIKLSQDITNFQKNYEGSVVVKSNNRSVKLKSKRHRLNRITQPQFVDKQLLEQVAHGQNYLLNIETHNTKNDQAVNMQSQQTESKYQKIRKRPKNTDKIQPEEQRTYFIRKRLKKYTDPLKSLEHRQGDENFLEINLPQTFNSFCELNESFNWSDKSGKLLCYHRIQQEQQPLFGQPQ